MFNIRCENISLNSALLLNEFRVTIRSAIKNHIATVLYSGTTDSGPSEIGTQYNRPLYKGHSSRSQIFVPYSSNTF